MADGIPAAYVIGRVSSRSGRNGYLVEAVVRPDLCIVPRHALDEIPEFPGNPERQKSIRIGLSRIEGSGRPEDKEMTLGVESSTRARKPMPGLVRLGSGDGSVGRFVGRLIDELFWTTRPRYDLLRGDS